VENKQALAISRLIGHVLHQSLSLRKAGQLKNWEGDYAEAVSLQSESLRIAREHNLLLPLLFGLWSYGVILTATADYDEALVMFEEGLVLTEKVGDELLRLYPRLLNSLGWLYIELGNLDRALDLNRQGAERAQKRGDAEMIANAEHYVGDIFLVKGDLALGQEYFDGVYRQVKNPATSDWMKWRYSTHLYASLGELWLAKGDPAKAREFADQCLEIATPTNSRK
jgi:tetratricopeptide (TPR) repeat protein